MRKFRNRHRKETNCRTLKDVMLSARKSRDIWNRMLRDSSPEILAYNLQDTKFFIENFCCLSDGSRIRLTRWQERMLNWLERQQRKTGKTVSEISAAVSMKRGPRRPLNLDLAKWDPTL